MSNTATPAVKAAEPTREELMAQIAALKAALTTAPKAVSIKTSEKGGVSVYGLGRFPVTLYASQWERLLSHAEEIKAFIQAHPELARKDNGNS